MFNQLFSKAKALFSKLITQHWTFWIVFAPALFLRFWYTINTNPRVRSYYVFFGGGHYDYIETIVSNLHLPSMNGNWEAFQPPLYYIISAIVFVFNYFWLIIADSKFENITDFDAYFTFWQQQLVFLYSLIFLIFSYRIICLVTKSKLTQGFCFALVAFWSSGIIHSARMGNDSLAYALFAVSLFWILKYYQDNNSISLKKSILFVGLALLTKANALTLIPILAYVVLVNNKSATKFETDSNNRLVPIKLHQPKKAILKSIRVICLTALFYLPTFVRGVHSTIVNGTDSLVSSASIIDFKLLSNNNWLNYFGFDVIAFLSNVWTNTRYDLQKDNFWHFLLKTSLYGEFEFLGIIQNWIARIMQPTVLILVATIIYFLVQDIWLSKNALKNPKDKKFGVRIILWLTVLISLLSLLVYRIKLPFVSNNDFRYIFPMIVPLAILILAPSVGEWRLSRLVRGLVSGLFVLTVMTTTIFYATMDYSKDYPDNNLAYWLLTGNYRQFYKTKIKQPLQPLAVENKVLNREWVFFTTDDNYKNNFRTRFLDNNCTIKLVRLNFIFISQIKQKESKDELKTVPITDDQVKTQEQANLPKLLNTIENEQKTGTCSNLPPISIYDDATQFQYTEYEYGILNPSNNSWTPRDYGTNNTTKFDLNTKKEFPLEEGVMSEEEAEQSFIKGGLILSSKFNDQTQQLTKNCKLKLYRLTTTEPYMKLQSTYMPEKNFESAFDQLYEVSLKEVQTEQQQLEDCKVGK